MILARAQPTGFVPPKTVATARENDPLCSILKLPGRTLVVSFLFCPCFFFFFSFLFLFFFFPTFPTTRSLGQSRKLTPFESSNSSALHAKLMLTLLVTHHLGHSAAFPAPTNTLTRGAMDICWHLHLHRGTRPEHVPGRRGTTTWALTWGPGACNVPRWTSDVKAAHPPGTDHCRESPLFCTRQTC